LNVYTQSGTTIGALETTHHLLNSMAGKLVVRDQIKEVIDYAKAKGVAIDYLDDDILPLWTTLQPNISEVRDLACSEVIRQQLRWFPSAITRFDYTQTPPRLEILTRPEMQAVTLELEPENYPGYQITEWDLRARPDLVRSKIMIRYERRDSLNGKQIMRLFDDVYPNPPGIFAPEPHALVLTIDQRGPDSQETMAEVELRRALPLTEDWWKENYGDRFVADGVSNFSIDTTSLRIKGPDDEYSVPWQDSSYQAYVSEIIDGQAAEWMLTGSGLPLLSVNLTFYIVAEWEETESVNVGTTKITLKGGPVQLEHSNNFCTYVLPTGVNQDVITFWNRSATPGDPQIIGLAQALYDQLSVLQYDGSVTIHEEECGFRARMGNTLNLLGVRPEYASMTAQIQSVRLDLASGNTMLTLGPARALGATDLIDLLQ